MTRRNIAVWSSCITLLLGTTACGSAAPARASNPDHIRVSMENTHGGGLGGAAESWTLRSDDTADHSQTFSAAAQSDGARDITDAHGILKEGSYANLLNYLQWTHLLNLKVEAPHEDGTIVTVELVRNGKVKSINMADSDRTVGTTLTLVSALTEGVQWKTAAEFKASTGMAVLFQIDDSLHGKDAEDAKAFPLPIFGVLNAAGKEVAVVRKNTDAQREAFRRLSPQFSESWVTNKDVHSYFTLAPGAYRLKFKNLDTSGSDSGSPAPGGFAWRPIYVSDEPVQVKPGRFTFTVIRLEKKKPAQ